jgi:hypothetical protein
LGENLTPLFLAEKNLPHTIPHKNGHFRQIKYTGDELLPDLMVTHPKGLIYPKIEAMPRTDFLKPVPGKK